MGSIFGRLKIPVFKFKLPRNRFCCYFRDNIFGVKIYAVYVAVFIISLTRI